MRRTVFRGLALVAMLAVLAPALAAGDTENVPVVTKISGSLTVRSTGGEAHDVGLLQVLRAGDVVTTGALSSSEVTLEGIARVLLGAQTSVQVFTPLTGLSLQLTAGTACVQTDGGTLTISTNGMTVTAQGAAVDFDIVAGAPGTTVAVAGGSVGTMTKAGLATLHEGDALAVDAAGTHREPASLLGATFAMCPPKRVAQATPSPTAEPQPSPTMAPSGGGGGFLGILLGLLAIGAAVGHGGGGGGNPTPPPPTPGPIQLNPSSLTFSSAAAPAQTFSASESNYTGPLNASSDNTGVATVSPASGTGPNVTFTVTPRGIGQAHISVTDNHSQSKSITATVQGLLKVNPGSLTLTVGATSNNTFTASENNYSGPINAQSSDGSLASVAPASGSGPGPVTFTVSALAAGNPNINVTDNHSGSTSVSLDITGPLSTNPTSLSFVGTTGAQPFTAMDPNFSGVITATSNNTNVATVACASPPCIGPNAMFNVTPVGQGNTSISLSDPNGGGTSISISVSTGGLVLNPTSLAVRINGTQTFTASEANLSGQFFAASSDKTLATVAPAQGPGPGPFTFTVTGVTAGNPSIAVHSSDQPDQFVTVAVTGPLKPTPTSLTFDGSSTASQPFTANDPNNSSAIDATVQNPSLASVSPASGVGFSVMYSVTPILAGSTTVHLIDGQGATSSVDVTIVTGPLQVAPASLTFNSPSAASQTFTASENFYNGPFNVNSSACANIVNVLGSGNGPSQTYTVAPVASDLAGGMCSINVADNHGGNQNVSVTVFGTLQTSTASLTFTDITPTQQFTATELNYSGPINASNCGALANVTPSSGTGPGPVTFTVTPVSSDPSGGNCNINVTDNHGTDLQVAVTIGPFGAVEPAPNSVSFNAAGQNSPVNVTETTYTGSFTAADSAANPCTAPGIATISPSSGASYTITAGTTVGNCAFVFSDDHGQSAEVQVFVTSGALTVSPPTIQFGDIGGAPTPAPFTATDPSNGTGSFTATSSNPLVASVVCVSVPCSGTSAQFQVNPLLDGQVTITVTDSIVGSQADVSIGVGQAPLIHKKHKGTGGKPQPPKPTPTPRPGATHAPVPTPQTAALTVSEMTVIALSNTARTVFASDPGFAGSLVVTSSNPAVAAARALPLGGSRWNIFITALQPGDVTITVSDGKSPPVSIRVHVVAPLKPPNPPQPRPPRAT